MQASIASSTMNFRQRTTTKPPPHLVETVPIPTVNADAGMTQKDVQVAARMRAQLTAANTAKHELRAKLVPCTHAMPTSGARVRRPELAARCDAGGGGPSDDVAAPAEVEVVRVGADEIGARRARADARMMVPLRDFGRWQPIRL